MAVQNQPVSEPSETGEAQVPQNPHFKPTEGPPVLDGSENGTTEVDFTGDGSDIKGNAATPDMGYNYLGGPRLPGVSDSIYKWPDGEPGITPDHIIGVVNRTAQEALKRASSFDDLHHHHDIYIFSHGIPVPIPITYFITDYSISELKRFPYTSGMIKLKMPFDLFRSIFTSTTGACSQPDTGAYIGFYKRKLDIVDQAAIQKFAGKQEDVTTIGLDMQCEHLGVVSALNYNMTADQRSGHIITEATIAFSSFIHHLIEGEYRTTIMNTVDTDVSNTAQVGQYTVDKDYFKVPGSATFYYKLNQYFEFVSEEIRAALGLPQAPKTEPVQSTLPEFLRAPAASTKATAAPVRESIGDSMQRFLHVFAYPMVPPSLTLMPLDYIAYAFAVMRGGVTNVLESFQRFVSAGVPVEQVELLMRGTAQALRQHAQKSSRLFNIREDDVDEARQLEDIIPPRVEDIDLLDLPLHPNAVSTEERRNKWNKFLKETAGLSLRLGDIVKVASCKKDVPPTSSWREMLPAEAPFFKDFNRIRTLKSKQKSIYGLLYSTFVPNEELFEMFPVLIPITLEDIDPKKSGEGYQVGPIHARLGVVPTIVYRMKPLVPGLTLTNEIVAQYLNKASYHQSGQNLTPTLFPQYELHSETSGIAYGQQSFYDAVYRTSLEKDAKYVSGPAVIRLSDVIDIEMNWNDSNRINATYVEIPGTQSVADKARYGMMSYPTVHSSEAMKHGLRIREYDYPFIDPGVVSSVGAPGNLATAMGEYAYLVNGQGQNFASGELLLRYQGGHQQFIQQGMWIAIDFYPTVHDDNQQNLTNDTGRTGSTYNVSSEHFFLCMVDQIDVSFDIDNLGHEVLRTKIGFSRGSYGSEIPAYPPHNVNGNEESYTHFELSKPVPVSTTKQQSTADIPGTQTQQSRQISPEVLEILKKPARGATKVTAGEAGESLIELIKQEPLEEQYKMFVREKIIEDTPENYTKYVTNREPFPQDKYDEVIFIIDQLQASGDLALDDLDPKLKKLYEAAQSGDDFYFEQ